MRTLGHITTNIWRRAGVSLRRYLRDDDGVALVEFAIILPMMLLVFAVIIESTRLLLSYEGAIAGVRDAARFVARAADPDICSTSGSVAGYTSTIEGLVENAATGSSVFAPGVTVDSVTPGYSCITGNFRASPVAIAQVTAQITITFPFAGVFTLVGASRPTLTTTITDKSRVFGS